MGGGRGGIVGGTIPHNISIAPLVPNNIFSIPCNNCCERSKIKNKIKMEYTPRRF